MKKVLRFGLLLSLFGTGSQGQAQVISRFTWDSNPVTTAAVGPNATSAGSSAVSSPGGVGGTNGLNPGSPHTNINLIIPNTGNIFNVNGLDVSIDYRRNESTATMFRRSTFISNNGAANFRMTYRVTDGSVVTTVTSTNVNIPQDNVFRNYRFTYDNCSGIGTMYVNNTVVWTSPTPTPNQNLYWAGDDNVIIGQEMDGAGNNIPNLDNFIWQVFTCSVLPIELIHFSGDRRGSRNLLSWSTASERNNDYFIIEHSHDGMSWRFLDKVYGAGTTKMQQDYRLYLEQPEKQLNYYRLIQTDLDQRTTQFSTIVIDNSEQGRRQEIRVMDLLGREMPSSYKGFRVVYYSDGSVSRLMPE
jgi:hypothetical protein